MKTLVWVVSAVLVALFAMANWTPVQIHLWGDLTVETKLAALVILAFVLGWLPTFAVHRVSLWRYRRRLNEQQRMLGEVHPLPAPMPESALDDTSAPPHAPSPASFSSPSASV